MQLYAAITKADQRIVEGIASTETIDSQPGVWEGHAYAGDVVDVGAIEAALPDYLEWSNVREMHQNSAAGVALSAEVVDGKLHLAVKVVDDGAWKKVKERVYKGFSIGGRVVEAVLEKLADGTYIRRILKLILTEISLVDRPANPDAKILLFKAEGSMPNEETEVVNLAPGLSAVQLSALQKLAGSVTALAKATDPTKIVALIQQLRNEAEVAGDMDGASMFTQAITLIMQASGEANEPEAEAPPPAEGDVPADQQMLASATATLRKAGRKLSGANLAAMENTVKTLLQMMATAGSVKAQKAITAMADGDEMTVAAAISAEFTKAITPIAQAVLVLNERFDRLPTAGGPVVRAPIQKVITGQPPAATETKPAMPNIIKAQLDDLHRRASTDPNPANRAAYQQRYEALRSEYQ
jgi:prohead serine protease